MSYKFGTWTINTSDKITSEEAISEHDQRTGAFVRLLATAEFSMKQIICTLLGVDLPTGSLLMSKMSAGQTADLFRDVAESRITDDLKIAATSAAKSFMNLNGFRNELAHGLHMFDGERAKIGKTAADLKKFFGKETDLSEEAFGKRISDLYEVLHKLLAISLKLAGDTRNLEDIVAMASEARRQKDHSHSNA